MIVIAWLQRSWTWLQRSAAAWRRRRGWAPLADGQLTARWRALDDVIWCRRRQDWRRR